MLAIMVESAEEEAGRSFAESLAGAIRDGIIGATLIGPTAATIRKIRDIYRHMIYVKSMDTQTLVGIKDRAEAYQEKSDRKDIRISFDLDPMNGY